MVSRISLPFIEGHITITAHEKGVINLFYSRKETRVDHGYDFGPILRALDCFLVGKETAFDSIELDYDKKSFAGRVLSKLRTIPFGRVISYGDLAALVNAPRAARAVGSVMANNPIPLFIPCHRVLPASGGIGEFGGGVRLKRLLLLHEGAMDELDARPARSCFYTAQV